jgi:predicted Co/Zn/Cd cation transporter (cation efflux family)
MAPTYRRLQQYALAISIISIIYCAAEGAVSVGLGSKSSSRSLVFFGVQSVIEVISATMVVWRFYSVARPGKEKETTLGDRELR